jgi:L-lactate dehydrogenase complex protein LldG
MTENPQRELILKSIRSALVSADEPEAIATQYAAIPRSYSRSTSHGSGDILNLFEDRLREYEAGVYRSVTSSIADTIREILSARGKHSLALPSGIAEEWLPEGFAFELAEPVDIPQLDRSEGILSGCTVAIAETGSIVLQNAPAQGPRALSLVPDYHLCVVFSHQIVATVPEAFARFADTSNLPTTFISGPSATADIEMTRIKGVHGPRFLDVLIVV